MRRVPISRMVALPELDFLLKVLHDFAARRGMNKIRCIVYIVITKNLSQPQKDSNTRKRRPNLDPKRTLTVKRYLILINRPNPQQGLVH